MKSILLVLLFPAAAFASNQNISCYGINQSGTLDLEFGVSSSASVSINDEGRNYASKLKKPVTNKDGTVTFVGKKDSQISVTVPKAWLDRGFDRFSKHDRKKGYMITEMVSFRFGKGQSLSISECESNVD